MCPWYLSEVEFGKIRTLVCQRDRIILEEDSGGSRIVGVGDFGVPCSPDLDFQAPGLF